jgi:demethoxyubiquinone hydroxylase (CLK1/Coq7/Cat5 family)
MSARPAHLQPRPSRRRRRRRVLPALLRLLLALALFAAGVAVGVVATEAPPRATTETVERGVRLVTVTETAARVTATVVVTTPPG